MLEDFLAYFFGIYITFGYKNPSILTLLDSTVVGLSTTPTSLIISKSLQFRTFWSQSKAFFMNRCMLSVGSGSEMFGALKVTILCQNFKTFSTYNEQFSAYFCMRMDNAK